MPKPIKPAGKPGDQGRERSRSLPTTNTKTPMPEVKPPKGRQVAEE